MPPKYKITKEDTKTIKKQMKKPVTQGNTSPIIPQSKGSTTKDPYVEDIGDNFELFEPYNRYFYELPEMMSDEEEPASCLWVTRSGPQ